MTRSRRKILGNTVFTLGLAAGVVAVLLFGIPNLPGLSVVNGTSMLPTFQYGDAAISVKQATYQTGDIIVYHPDNLPCARCNIIHRITGTEPTGGYITKGDNNPNMDPWHPTNKDVIGKVMAYIPLRGWLRMVYMPQFWMTLISLAGTIMMGLRLRRMLKTPPAPIVEAAIAQDAYDALPANKFMPLDSIYAKRAAHNQFPQLLANVDTFYSHRVSQTV